MRGLLVRCSVRGRQRELVLLIISIILTLYTVIQQQTNTVASRASSTDTKGRSILMEQVLERSVQVTENVEVKYKVDQASDTWVGPLPCCWHLLPQAYLVSHPLYKTFKRQDLRLTFSPVAPVLGEG